jgi:hypothetical protein
MQIPLDQFEQYINETILKKGLSYFKKGCVHEPEELSSGKIEAIVEGTELYTVNLTIQSGVLTDFNCDCPYDMGPICKHITAVIFYLQKDELNLDVKKKEPKKSKTKQPAKQKTTFDQVKEVLEKAPHEELVDFIREIAKANNQFRDLLLLHFANLNTNESKDQYIFQVKNIIKAGSDRYGSIPRSNTKHVGNAINSLLEVAYKHIENKNYKSAFYICTSVMEQMVIAIRYSDDSNGIIGDVIYNAFDLIKTMAEEQTTEDIRKLLLDYCFTAVDKEIYAGWDWHLGFMELSSDLIKTEDEVERILSQIDNFVESEYDREHGQKIKYDVLLKTRGIIEAEKYIEENITNSNLRNEAIQRAIESKNYNKAISIAQDGVNYDKKDKPGLVWQWYDWLLVVAQEQNDTDNIIEYARLLLVSNFHPKQDYYKILKQTVSPEKWKSFLEDVILRIIARTPWLDTDLIGSIYIKEEWWDQLFELVKSQNDLYILENYEKYLLNDFANEIIDLYAKFILIFMEKNSSRTHYRHACYFIRKIITLGAQDKANEVIKYLITEYPRRKALIDELFKFKILKV